MSGLDRRSLLGMSALGAGAMLAGAPAAVEAAVTAKGYGDGNDRWIIDDTSAVADTDSGKVVGYVRGGIRIFKGIPYGKIPTTEGRWKRGAKVQPWTGKRSCRAPGPVCPTQIIASPAVDELAMRDSDAKPMRSDEDCLRLNVWTPGTDNKKRHVLFYLHGGAFYAGSPLMVSRYESHNLARYGDVVVVNSTHREHALGFLDLTAHGGNYADSANLGMFDVVDAMKWVRANIANFGGDPDKVTIFGHSGGGAMVLALLAMPEAKGLFYRAIAQSPNPLPFATPDQAATRTAEFFKRVDIAPSNLDALHKVPLQKIIDAAIGISDVYKATVKYKYKGWNLPTNDDWLPVVDGRTVLYDPTAPTIASDIPLLVGNVLHEQFGALGHPEYMVMKEDAARAIGRNFYGPVADGMFDVYKGAFPNANHYEISAMVRATGEFRAFSVKLALSRATIKAAPTYNYWVQWRADTFEGRAMSHHEMEMPLVFMNSDEVPTVTGGTTEARALSVKMTDAWLAFARTGIPATAALPDWHPVTPQAMTTMVFDDNCHIDHGCDLAAIEMFWKERFTKA